MKIAITPAAYHAESLVAKATSAGNKEPIIIPMYGISNKKAAKKPKKKAFSIPKISNPTEFNKPTMNMTVNNPYK